MLLPCILLLLSVGCCIFVQSRESSTDDPELANVEKMAELMARWNRKHPVEFPTLSEQAKKLLEHYPKEMGFAPEATHFSSKLIEGDIIPSDRDIANMEERLRVDDEQSSGKSNDQREKRAAVVTNVKKWDRNVPIPYVIDKRFRMHVIPSKKRSSAISFLSARSSWGGATSYTCIRICFDEYYIWNLPIVLCHGITRNDGIPSLMQIDSDSRKKFPEETKTLLRAAIQTITDNTCLTMEENGPGKMLEYFKHNKKDECYTSLGDNRDDVKHHPETQKIYLGPGCLDIGTIQHETMHSLGFDHTQTRTDRDDYIRFNKTNIKQSWMKQYFKWTLAESATTYDIPYEYNSVMHYPATSLEAQIDPSKPAMMPRDINYLQSVSGDRPTFNDWKFINIHYRCNETCPNEMKCLNGGYQNPRKCEECVCPQFHHGTDCQFERNAPGLSLGETKDLFIRYRLNTTLYHDPSLNYTNYQRSPEQLIKGPEGTRILLTIHNLTDSEIPKLLPVCRHKALEVVDGDDLTKVGKRFCSQDFPEKFPYTVLSKTNVVGYVVFAKAGLDFTVKATFSVVDPNAPELASTDSPLLEELTTSEHTVEPEEPITETETEESEEPANSEESEVIAEPTSEQPAEETDTDDESEGTTESESFETSDATEQPTDEPATETAPEKSVEPDTTEGSEITDESSPEQESEEPVAEPDAEEDTDPENTDGPDDPEEPSEEPIEEPSTGEEEQEEPEESENSGDENSSEQPIEEPVPDDEEPEESEESENDESE